MPKESSQAQLVEANANNLRFSTEIAPTDTERDAIWGDAAAVNALITKIQEQPMLEGVTPKDGNTNVRSQCGDEVPAGLS
jgi:hypothetical protein